jgi:PAS domain S-box-containing protein
MRDWVFLLIYGLVFLGLGMFIAKFFCKRGMRARQDIEKNLRESEERYRIVTETSPDCIKLFDTKGRLLFINRGGLIEHRLKDMEEARSWNYLEGIIAEDREKFSLAFRQAVEGTASTIEIRHTPQGSLREACLEGIAPVRDEKGKITGIFGVSRDITRVKQLERTKELLIHTIIHDLKAPLSMLLLSVVNLEKSFGGALDTDQKRRFGLSLVKIQEMSSMISNLLDIHVAEEGKLALRLEETNIPSLAREAIDSLLALARHENKNITLACAFDLPHARLDRDIVKRVLLNLLGNALKYSPEHSEIEVSAVYARDAREIRIAVKDRGQGIPPEFLEKIFEKFTQVNGPERARVGHGLGLTFCKMGVEAHGGSISVESALGKGSTFTFTIPLREVR